MLFRMRWMMAAVAGMGALLVTECGALGAGGASDAAPIVPKSIEDLKAIQTKVEGVVRTALPATVAILLEDAQGSGVIVSKDGFVLTAGHVSGTPGQEMVIVLSSGREVRAKALGADNGMDSGMVKIVDAAPAGGWPFVSMGTDRGLKSGEWVVALGHPGGYRRDRPPVVRLGRVLLATRSMIGTDCTLINGDSGGPLFDLEGKLVGIHSRIGTTLTTNIDVPIDTYSVTWDRLAKGEEWGGKSNFTWKKPVLPLPTPKSSGPEPSNGVVLGVMAIEDKRGVLISKVGAGTPAELGGMKEGDVVTVFDGIAVKTPGDLVTLVGRHKAGDGVVVVVLRGGKTVSVAVKL